MTLKEAKSLLSAMGMVLKYDRDLEEYNVNLKGGKEATRYYTPDLDDAVGTAKCMAEHQAKQATCKWFLRCTNRATGTQDHPILGAVPICKRCKAIVAGPEVR